MERIDGNTTRDEAQVQDQIVSYSTLTGLPPWVITHFLRLTEVGKGQFQWIDANNGVVQMHPDTARVLLGLVQSGTTDFDSCIRTAIHNWNRDAKASKRGRRR